MTNRSLIRILLIIFIIIPGIPFILGSLGFSIYAFWPRDVSNIISIDILNSTTHISISAHGVKDSSESWSDELQATMSNRSIPNQQNISLDWRPFSDNPFICSVSGKQIGQQLGEKIADASNIKTVHAIGHSCGAYIVLGLCEGIKATKKNIKIHTTYLAPVSVYAGFFWQYGINNFGSCGDFSDAYIDKDDKVPGSNQSLPHAHTFDVKQLRIKFYADEKPHNWPTKYYLDALKQDQVPLYVNSGDGLNTIYPKGKLSVFKNES